MHLHCSKRLSGRYETIMWFAKGDDYIFNLDPIRILSRFSTCEIKLTAWGTEDFWLIVLKERR